MKNLIPHLYFKGDCLEAINFYMYIFKGEIETLDKYKDLPTHSDPKTENLISLSHFKFQGGEFYASDIISNESLNRQPIAMCLELDTKEELETFLNKLQKPDNTTPIQQTFFGNFHAEFDDPYGVRWNLFCN